MSGEEVRVVVVMVVHGPWQEKAVERAEAHRPTDSLPTMPDPEATATAVPKRQRL